MTTYYNIVMTHKMTGRVIRDTSSEYTKEEGKQMIESLKLDTDDFYFSLEPVQYETANS
jgi:hypothetical protein